MKKIVVTLSALLLLSCFLIGCDPYKYLSEGETEELVSQLQEELGAGKPWQYTLQFSYEDNEIENNSEFIRCIMEYLFKDNGKEQFESRYAMWYSTRSHRIYNMTGEVQLRYNDINYVITEVSISVNRNSKAYGITICYHEDKTDINKYIGVSIR